MQSEEIRRKVYAITENDEAKVKKIYANHGERTIEQIFINDPYYFVDNDFADFNPVDKNTVLYSHELRKHELRSGITSHINRVISGGNSFIPYNTLNYRVSKDLKENGHYLSTEIYPYLKYFSSIFYYDEESGLVSFSDCHENEMIIEQFVQNHLGIRSNFSVVNIPDDIDDEKKEILRQVQNQRFSIVTGGPGVGKTTWTKAFINGIPANKKIMVTATTGKASRRAAEVLADILASHENVGVSTLHKFIGYGHQLSHAEKMAIRDTDILIIDEASMLDDEVTAKLFKLIGDTDMSVIFVGDVNQLPSVGAGNVLRDLRLLGVPTYTLTRNFRTESPTIKDNYEKVLVGDTNLVFDNTFEIKEMYDVHEDTSDIILSPYIDDSIDFSASRVNEVYRVNKWHDTLQFHISDEVIFLETNYKAGYMNGDTGVIVNMDAGAYYVTLQHGEESPITVRVTNNEHLMLNHAITVHKSQGSEYRNVGIVIPKFNASFTTRYMLYTALSRAKSKVTLYTTREILEQIINNETVEKETFISRDLRLAGLPAQN